MRTHQTICSWVIALYILIAIFPLTACTVIEPPTKILRVALTAPVHSLDVANAADNPDATVAWQLYNSLLFFRTNGANPGGTLEPALATGWTSAPAADDPTSTTYTFTLRTDVTFHNDEPFDANAVVYSWQRGKRTQNLNARHWAIARRVEAVDSHTVAITTAGPQPLFLHQIALHWAMVPLGYLEQVGEDGFAQHPVGTGPFVFVEWDEAGQIVMDAHDTYWRAGYPLLDRLIFHPIPTATERIAALEAGEVDIVPRLSAEEAESLREIEGMAAEITTLSYPVDRVYYIAFNNLDIDNVTVDAEIALADRRVRQAFNYAVDTQTIIHELFAGYARPSTGLVTPDNLGYDPLIQAYPYDPEKARQLLATAGYGDGFTIDMTCPTGVYAHIEQLCADVQRYLGEVGVTVNLEMIAPETFGMLQAQQALPPLYADSRATPLGEALLRLNDTLLVPESPLATWHDPVIRRYVTRLSTTLDETERARLYVGLQRYMKANPPFLYLYEPVTFEAARTIVQNYASRIDEQVFFVDVDVVHIGETQ